jgi:hypothetical protein
MVGSCLACVVDAGDNQQKQAEFLCDILMRPAAQPSGNRPTQSTGLAHIQTSSRHASQRKIWTERSRFTSKIDDRRRVSRSHLGHAGAG